MYPIDGPMGYFALIPLTVECDLFRIRLTLSGTLGTDAKSEKDYI